MARAIDCLVNVDLGDMKQPEWMVRVKEDYFKGGDSFFTSPELPELLDDMDAQRRRARDPADQARRRDDRAQRYAAERPDRFALGVGGLNLLRPMKTLRALESFVRDHPVAYATVGPSFWGDGMYPPSDAVYYPLYTKCCELDLPLCLNTGIPGPPIPGEAQNPIHLDRVCVRFPELRLCMIHGADPWWDVAIRLMLKYKNLRLMTSAWSPKRLPESLLHYMPTRGKDRILFASDYPVLSMERCLGEAAALDLPPEVLDAVAPRQRRGVLLLAPRRRLSRRPRKALLSIRKASLPDAIPRRSSHGPRADRRRQPLLRAARRLHPAPRQEVHASAASARCRTASGCKLLIGGKVNRFIPNPTFDPIIVPGCLDPLFRGQIPEGVDPRSLMQVEPLRAEYRDRDARSRSWTSRASTRRCSSRRSAAASRRRCATTSRRRWRACSAFNRWLEEDWGFDYEGRLIAAPMLSLADPDAAVAEVDSLLERGARIVHVRPAPVPGPNGTSRSLGDKLHDPVWARLAEASVPVAFHLGDSGYNAASPRPGAPATSSGFGNSDALGRRSSSPTARSTTRSPR